ncbi:MAG: M24 family metallopeptidase [Mycoplasmoidaceae bacterium]
MKNFEEKIKFSICLEKLKQLNADALFFRSKQNRFWSTGFPSSEGFVVITKSEIYCFLDGRYYEKAKIFFSNTTVKLKKLVNLKSVINFLKEDDIKILLVEEEYLTINYYLSLQKENFDLININTQELRILKTPFELEKLTKAAKIATEAMEWLKTNIKPGMTELEVAAMSTHKMLMLGAEKISFDPIIASGINGGFPHHNPTNKKIEDGEFVTIDMGCIYEGYCSDLTRTFPIGKPKSIQMQKIYDIVLNANLVGIDSVKSGLTGKEIDKLTRDVINKAGYGEYFIHNTGHGVGIDIHELPNVSQNYDKVINEGSVITIEPGIYIPGVGGVRIEDDVYVTKDGHIVLTSGSSK